jgi:hypothetical protein
MSDLEVTTSEVTAPEVTNAPETTETAVETPEISTHDAIANNAEKVAKARENPAKPGVVSGKPGEAVVPGAFTPNLKYKVMDKEHEIPKEFQSLMKDADSEKKVREIFERSTGLDVVKENLSSARNERDQSRKQYAELNGSIADLRQTYQSAVQSGDLHKLDQFWKKLDISQDTIMQYALEKVKLHEMAPEQRNALMAKQNAEFHAEELRRQQANQNMGFVEQSRQLKQLMLESAHNRPEISAAATDFDSRVGKPGMFKEEVRKWGEQEWLRSNGKIDLSPDQAIAAVIKHYGLNTTPQATVATPAAVTGNVDPRKNVIVKPAGTIPNLGSGGSQSPLKSKPRSIEDLKKLANRAANGEAI